MVTSLSNQVLMLMLVPVSFIYMCVCRVMCASSFMFVATVLFPVGSDLFLVSVILISEPALLLCDCEYISRMI